MEKMVILAEKKCDVAPLRILFQSTIFFYSHTKFQIYSTNLGDFEIGRDIFDLSFPTLHPWVVTRLKKTDKKVSK